MNHQMFKSSLIKQAKSVTVISLRMQIQTETSTCIFYIYTMFLAKLSIILSSNKWKIFIYIVKFLILLTDDNFYQIFTILMKVQ